MRYDDWFERETPDSLETNSEANRRLWAGLWPTRRQMREFNAPGMADAIIQIVRRDVVYRGLGE